MPQSRATADTVVGIWTRCYVKNERMHYEKEVRKLICALQKCVDEIYNEDFADVETFGGWLCNLTPCPQSLVIEAQSYKIEAMNLHVAQARWNGLSDWLKQFWYSSSSNAMSNACVPNDLGAMLLQ